ncbi:MAG: hypothetical protein ACRD04_06250 [Terriglobales bacterium]
MPRRGMRGLRAAIAACVVADAFLLVAASRARRDYFFVRSPFRDRDATLAVPSGYKFDGAAFNLPSRPRCALIQFTSTLCLYCAENWQATVRLSQLAGNAGCTLVTLAPTPDQLPVRQAIPGQADLAWVGPEWLEGLPRLELEPTAFHLGPDGAVIWQAEGELTSSDIRAAMRRLRSALGRR